MKALVKHCSKCGHDKSIELFSNDKTSKDGLCHWCKNCCSLNSRRHHENNKNSEEYKLKRRDSYLRTTYNISLNDYNDMLNRQDGKCLICIRELADGGHTTHVDHCHSSGEVRGLLCTNCNRGLGYFKEDVDSLYRAITYLSIRSSDHD